MRYVIKQKIFSFADKFTIKDEYDTPHYEVEGKLFSIGKKLDIYDMDGKHQFYIEQKILRFLPSYSIFKGDLLLATVKKELTLFKPRFRIESSFGNFTLQGNIIAHEFEIIRDGQTVAWISKKLISWSDTYTIDIRSEEEDHAFYLALVIVIDQVIHDNQNKG